MARFIAWLCVAVELLVCRRDKILRPTVQKAIGINCSNSLSLCPLGGLALVDWRRKLGSSCLKSSARSRYRESEDLATRLCSPKPHILAGRQLRAASSVQRAL